jgi:hypothetical protein
MAVYSVFEPPQRASRTAARGAARAASPGAAAERAERFVFLRDGFSWGAFLFGPLWLLYRRLWLVLVGYVIVVAALHVGLFAARVGSGAEIVVSVLVALLLGFEASTLRRFKLVRRRWREIGIVTGDDLEHAERRFFDAWVAGEEARPAPPVTILRPPSPSSDVIGLFPEPGGSR